MGIQNIVRELISVQIGVEAGGHGLASDDHCATLIKGTPGILHGTCTYVLQDKDGQIKSTHSISAGLDYPAVGPEHAHLKDSGRAQYVAVDDKQVSTEHLYYL